MFTLWKKINSYLLYKEFHNKHYSQFYKKTDLTVAHKTNMNMIKNIMYVREKVSWTKNTLAYKDLGLALGNFFYKDVYEKSLLCSPIIWSKIQ